MLTDLVRGIVRRLRRRRAQTWPLPVYVVTLLADGEELERVESENPALVMQRLLTETYPEPGVKRSTEMHAVVGVDSDRQPACVFPAMAHGEVGHGEAARDAPIAYLPLGSPDWCARCDVKGVVGQDLIGVGPATAEFRCRDRRACEKRRRQRATA